MHGFGFKRDVEFGSSKRFNLLEWPPRPSSSQSNLKKE